MLRFLLVCSCVLAQESIHYASAGGRVTDPSGANIEGARVIVRQTETNFTATVNTDSEGRFRFGYLKVGPYRVAVEHPGFAAVERAFEAGPGSAFEFDFTLQLNAGETSVEVTGDTAALEAARSQIAVTVKEREISSLPLNGRSFLDVALLSPGVSPANTGSNQLFPETSAAPGQGVSVGGQRNFSNSFIVDGLSANDDAAGLSGMFYGLDTVREVQVVTSGGQAELGRALGGYVNVVTRSGTNQFRGDLYGYFRNQRWNASNPLSNTTLPLTQSQYGSSLGGPVLRDRTFFFGNFEQRILNQSGLTTISPANLAVINARLDETGFPGPRITSGIYPNPVHAVSGFAKLDHQVTQRDQFTLRYSIYDVDSVNSRGAGALSATSASAGLTNSDQAVAVSNILALSPWTVNETRGQYTHSDLLAEPSDLTGPAVSISGIASFGRLSGSPTGRLNDMVEVVNNISHRSGAHALRAGANFLYNDTTITFPRSIKGQYAFSSLANFRSGVYNNGGYTQTFGPDVIQQKNPNAGLYAQDEWKVRPSLTLNLGVRYDLQFLDTIQTRRNNLSPRGGFAWSPFRSGATIVRGGFGLFYDRIPLRALANALLSSGNTTVLTPASQVSVSLSPGQAGAPVFPNILTSLPPGVLMNFSTMDRQIPNAYATQGNIELERRLGRTASFTAGYQHLRGIHLLVSINQNVPACVASGSNNGCRPNSGYANNSQYRGAADSRYDGVHVTFVQRPVRWGSYRLSYTYSKSFNNVGEFFFSSPIDPFNIWRDWGRSDDDQRHRVVFNGALDAPFKIQIGGWLHYYSALPLNITTGANTIQGTAARPVLNGSFIDRNSGEGSDFFEVNLRVSRLFALSERLKVEALAEAFNALNHRNNLTRNGVFGTGPYPLSPSPLFGQVTAVNDPRSLQLALKVRF